MIKSDNLSDPEMRRFDHQIALSQIGSDGQQKIKNANIVVVGAGGLGSVILQYLAASGIGHLGIIDYALVDETNIQRQTLYGGNDLGKLKTIISRQHLQNLFPLINFEIINLQLISDNAERILAPFDLIIDATNDEDSHLIISDACKILKLPWILGSVQQFTGGIAVFDKNNELGYQALRSAKGNSWDRYMGGSASVVYGIIGNMMVLEAIKLIVHISGALKNQILSVNLLSYQCSVESF